MPMLHAIGCNSLSSRPLQMRRGSEWSTRRAFEKSGTHSVGVARQYLGAAGKIANGQVATVLSYAAKGANVFLDRQLYLPEEWIWDKRRRTQARVPQEVRFATKPQQAIAMLKHAWEQGVPMQWVTGDEVYGDSPR